MTLMANRSDRRFQTLSPSMAREAARLIGNEARGNPSRPGLHLEPNEQAGYMTATEFQIASAITLARGRGPYMLGGALARSLPIPLQYHLAGAPGGHHGAPT